MELGKPSDIVALVWGSRSARVRRTCRMYRDAGRWERSVGGGKPPTKASASECREHAFLNKRSLLSAPIYRKTIQDRYDHGLLIPPSVAKMPVGKISGFSSKASRRLHFFCLFLALGSFVWG